MVYTLRQRLECNAPQSQTVEDFFNNNVLANCVLGGETSYRKAIKPIEERYGSFWSRVFAPSVDEEFDDNVRGVADSINSVGADNVKADFYTTRGVKKFIRVADAVSLSMGACIGGLMTLMRYTLPELPPETDVYTRTFMDYLPAVMAVMPYFMVKAIPLRLTGLNLNSLREAAEKTDSFLGELSLSD